MCVGGRFTGSNYDGVRSFLLYFLSKMSCVDALTFLKLILSAQL